MVLMVIELVTRCPRMEIRKWIVQLGLLNPSWLYIWPSKQKSMKTFSVQSPCEKHVSSEFRILFSYSR